MSSERELPEISIAVRMVREGCGESQDVFARRLGTTSTSVSRIERGLQTPGFDLLNRLEKTARDLELVEEARLFDETRTAVRFTAYRPPEPQDTMASYSLPQWRLAMAARIAITHFPEQAPAIEKALHPAIEIVDEVLRSTDEAEIDYGRMEREVFSRAERRKLQDLKRQGSMEDSK